MARQHHHRRPSLASLPELALHQIVRLVADPRDRRSLRASCRALCLVVNDTITHLTIDDRLRGALRDAASSPDHYAHLATTFSQVSSLTLVAPAPQAPSPSPAAPHPPHPHHLAALLSRLPLIASLTLDPPLPPPCHPAALPLALLPPPLPLPALLAPLPRLPATLTRLALNLALPCYRPLATLTTLRSLALALSIQTTPPDPLAPLPALPLLHTLALTIDPLVCTASGHGALLNPLTALPALRTLVYHHAAPPHPLTAAILNPYLLHYELPPLPHLTALHCTAHGFPTIDSLAPLTGLRALSITHLPAQDDNAWTSFAPPSSGPPTLPHLSSLSAPLNLLARKAAPRCPALLRLDVTHPTHKAPPAAYRDVLARFNAPALAHLGLHLGHARCVPEVLPHLWTLCPNLPSLHLDLFPAILHDEAAAAPPSTLPAADAPAAEPPPAAVDAAVPPPAAASSPSAASPPAEPAPATPPPTPLGLRALDPTPAAAAPADTPAVTAAATPAAAATPVATVGDHPAAQPHEADPLGDLIEVVPAADAAGDFYYHPEDYLLHHLPDAPHPAAAAHHYFYPGALHWLQHQPPPLPVLLLLQQHQQHQHQQGSEAAQPPVDFSALQELHRLRGLSRLVLSCNEWWCEELAGPQWPPKRCLARLQQLVDGARARLPGLREASARFCGCLTAS